MISKTPQSPGSDIDLKDLFISFWKNKLLYLFLIFFFALLGFLHSLTVNKNIELESSIIIKEPPTEFFSNFKPFFDDLRIKFSEEAFKETFRENIMSMDNLQKFVDQNTEIDKLKFFLQENQTNAKLYFKSRLIRQKKKIGNKTINSNYYSLIYPEFVDGNKFFNEYIIFSKDISIESFKTAKIFQVNNTILLIEQNLEIANEIDLENPIIQNYDGNTQSYILGEPTGIYYEGTKVLEKRIEHLKSLVMRFDSVLSYNPILDSASIVSSNMKSEKKYPFYGLIFGLVLSFVIVLIRNIIKQSK